MRKTVRFNFYKSHVTSHELKRYSFVTTKGVEVFSWDETKNQINRQKHGVSFETAQLVFEDPCHISRQDRIEGGEQRWQTIGQAGGVLLLLVAHTWQDHIGGVEHIRIISARRATKQERKAYEQST